jgi:type I restriction enzyme R subunit
MSSLKEAIEQLLLELGELYSELDDIATLPQRMGFEDKGTFEIFTLIKNARTTDFHEELTREFAKDVVDSVIRKKVYIGWQDVANEINRLRVNIEIFAASDNDQQLAIDDDAQLMDAIMLGVVKNFGLK